MKFKVQPLTQARPCSACGAAGDLVCPTKEGASVVLCLGCARDLGRMWAAQHGD